jgi:hypothetical protein
MGQHGGGGAHWRGRRNYGVTLNSNYIIAYFAYFVTSWGQDANASRRL